MRRRSFLAVSVSSLLPELFPHGVQAAASAWSSTAASSPQARKTAVSSIAILANTRDTAEAAAAHELARYLTQIAGVAPRLLDDASQLPSGTVLFLVGRTRLTEELLVSGIIQDPAQKHPEAYLVHSVGGVHGGRLVFLGGSGIATLYAVYHYLEAECGCGFYWDGEHIPQGKMVPAQDVALGAQPWFTERMCMNLTLYWYSVPWWEWEDWKTYIDWTLKARLNILSLWCTPGADAAWERAWNRLGIKVDDSSYSGPPYGIFTPIKYGVRGPLSRDWRDGQSQLTKKIIEYARARGMRTLAPGVSGIIPPDYLRAHPDAHTFESSWAHLPRQRYLHPQSAAFHETGKTFLEEYISLYGTDHLYWLENYLECDIVGPPALQEGVRREIAAAGFRIIDDVDPKGIGILSAWTFLNNPQVWTTELISEHLRQLPADRARVLDQWGDVRPVYKRTSYFDGVPWYFGVIHSFGGTTTLHGNMSLLEKRFRGITEDPRAQKCVGFSPTEEVFHHNYFYFEFLMKLGWNPKSVDLKTFTMDYIRGRYGDKAAPVMTMVFKELLASVYGSDDLTLPAYWHRPGLTTAVFPLYFSDRRRFIPHLRRALAHALQARNVLRDNPLYRHDLNDIARQYLSELFNAHLTQLRSALAEQDRQAFEREAALVERILDTIIELLGHDDYYWLSPYLRKASRLPGAPADVEQRARDVLTLWAGVIRDYAARDYYELVAGYYRPRVVAYIKVLRECLDDGQLMVYDQDALDSTYDAIEKKWVSEGFAIIDRQPNPKHVIDTAENLWPHLKKAEGLWFRGRGSAGVNPGTLCLSTEPGMPVGKRVVKQKIGFAMQLPTRLELVAVVEQVSSQGGRRIFGGGCRIASRDRWHGPPVDHRCTRSGNGKGGLDYGERSGLGAAAVINGSLPRGPHWHLACAGDGQGRAGNACRTAHHGVGGRATRT